MTGVVTFVAPTSAPAAAALAWMFLEWWDRGEPNVLGAASGAVAGLGGIPPRGGLVGPIPARLLGLRAGGPGLPAGVEMGPARGCGQAPDTFRIHRVGRGRGG